MHILTANSPLLVQAWPSVPKYLTNLLPSDNPKIFKRGAHRPIERKKGKKEMERKETTLSFTHGALIRMFKA